MKKLAGKAAIVTGAAGGMGRAYALRLAQLGANVAIFDINLLAFQQYGEQIGADSVVAELESFGVQALGIEVNLVDRSAVQAAIDQVVSRFGRLDIIVNNAGGAITPADTSTASVTSPEDTRTLFALNYDTMINMCQLSVPYLRRRGGAVVNVSTIGAETDDIGGRFAMYGAAKAALLAYSRSLAVELGPDHIRVNCIAPGLIETARIKALAAERNLATREQAQGIPLRRLGQVEDVVGAMEYLVTDMSAYVTGECIRVSGGLTLVSA
ncbi:MAG: SDR family oxidoreductase [Gammaproteobacteria bacterium]|nr:SDR family oxidoreductase [Gammaproteobacteria bacterium]